MGAAAREVLEDRVLEGCLFTAGLLEGSVPLSSAWPAPSLLSDPSLGYLLQASFGFWMCLLDLFPPRNAGLSRFIKGQAGQGSELVNGV